MTPLLDAGGKVALVTGAAGGIGRAIAHSLRDAGAVLALIDRAPVREAGPLDWTAQLDCADPEQVREAIARLSGRHPRIDFVVHAAGSATGGAFAGISPAAWRQTLADNLDSAFLLLQAVHPHLARPGASVVLFSSTNGRNGGSARSGAAYAAAKAGILNLTRHLALEWAAEGIRVNCLAPGPVATPMLDRFSDAEREALRRAVPLGRIAGADEVAAAAAFLCSVHAASMTGACLNLSGGLVLD